MSESANLSWSTYEQVRSESEYNTRMKIASELQNYIDRSSSRGLNNHFISGLELAMGVVMQTTLPLSDSTLDSDTLF